MAQVVQLAPTYDQANPEVTVVLMKQMEILVSRIASLERLVRTPVTARRSVWFNLREGARQVALDEITHCAADSNYCMIHLTNGSRLLVSLTLKAVEALLDDSRFLRVHQSYLVNRDKVVTVSSNHESSITLAGGQILPVSRANRKRVRDQLCTGTPGTSAFCEKAC